MTQAERKLANDLKDFERVELHRHISINGKKYWKVKHDERALMCLTYTLFNKLESRGHVTGDNSLRSLNVIALRAALLDWQLRKDKRKTKNTQQ